MVHGCYSPSEVAMGTWFGPVGAQKLQEDP